MSVEGRADLSTAVKVRSPCLRLYIAAAITINTTAIGEIRTCVPRRSRTRQPLGYRHLSRFLFTAWETTRWSWQRGPWRAQQAICRLYWYLALAVGWIPSLRLNIATTRISSTSHHVIILLCKHYFIRMHGYVCQFILNVFCTVFSYKGTVSTLSGLILDLQLDAITRGDA